MLIGKIARSSSHIDYVCQVCQPGEVPTPPRPEDHAFGTFVRIKAGVDSLVGLIYDTVLLNPEFGALGPRLSPTPDLAVFSPDYLNEKVTVVGIIAIGTWSEGGMPRHGVPPLTAQIGDSVETLTDAEIRAFHGDGRGGVRLGYAPVLIAHGSPLARHLLLNIAERLEGLCPDCRSQLRVLRANVAWRATIEPLG
jgi:hypothetical protein